MGNQMPKILLVEDDDIMISLLQTLLEIEGYEVGRYQLGEDMLRAIQRENPQLLLLDVHLRMEDGEEINGFDLLKQLRREPELQSVKVIISSGLDFSKESRQAGADGFIHKPYMPEELIEVVKQTLS
jgi:CheY-like chemotaxis protein